MIICSNKAIAPHKHKPLNNYLWQVILARKRLVISGGIAGLVLAVASFWVARWWKKKEAALKAKEDIEHKINSIDLIKLRDANLISIQLITTI